MTLQMQVETSKSVRGVAEALDDLAISHGHLSMASKNQPAEIRNVVLNSLQSALLAHSSAQNSSGNERAPVHMPPDLVPNLKGIVKESHDLERQIDIIKSLQFPGMIDREENIKTAHESTFEWLFDAADEGETSLEQTNILQWLETGSKNYWISGKAGSGKSTLMKFFSNHDKTHAALRRWSGHRQLLVASFFFWNAGNDPMQKSQHGLLQTLLCNILKQAPDLIPEVCSSRWESLAFMNEPWRFEELSRILSNLPFQKMESIRFCFFIDGLDEYDGDHFDVINIVKRLSSSLAVKCCFSSRPWNVFEIAYGNNHGFKIRLQDLTRNDIARFAKDKLFEGHDMLQIHVQEDLYRDLVEDIVERSDGVFLWVFLVVRSLRRGMTNRDTVKELQDRLRELPTELEAFFRHIFESTDHVYQKQAARLYRICLVAKCQVSALDLAWFGEDDPNLGLREDAPTLEPSQLVEMSADTVIRVHARCQDLLEFVGANLQFLHRTVRDFLETGDVFVRLRAQAGSNFDPHRYLCLSKLLQIRIKGRLAHTQRPWLQQEKLMQLCDGFLQHARSLDYELDFGTEFGAFIARLLRLVDRGLCSLSYLESQYLGLESSELYHQGWVFVILVYGRISHLLYEDKYHLLDRTRVPFADQISLNPLYFALFYMKSDHRFRLLHHLLESGANLNEKFNGAITIWERYIEGLSFTQREKEMLREAMLEDGGTRLFESNHPLLRELSSEQRSTLEAFRLGGRLEGRPLTDHHSSLSSGQKRNLEDPHEGSEARKKNFWAGTKQLTRKPAQRSLADRISHPQSIRHD